MDDWKYDYLIQQIHRASYKRHESFVLGALVHDPRLAALRVCTQFYAPRGCGGYALVDIFYPQIDLAVEVDAPHHGAQAEADSVRQQDVEVRLECQVHRIDVVAGDVPEQVSRLKEMILAAMEEAKTNGTWREWERPTRVDVDTIRSELKNTMFVKILGEIHPGELLARQTGYWSIHPSKRRRIRQVVVARDGVVTRVFDKVDFHEWLENPKPSTKWGYKGIDVTGHALIGAIVDGWNYQRTPIYSFDLY